MLFILGVLLGMATGIEFSHFMEWLTGYDCAGKEIKWRSRRGKA